MTPQRFMTSTTNPKGKIGGLPLPASALPDPSCGAAFITHRYCPPCGQATWVCEQPAALVRRIVKGVVLAFSLIAPAAAQAADSGAFTDTGLLPGATYGEIHALSADGSVAVGYVERPNAFLQGIRWTRATGLVNLGNLNGYSISIATGVSADGSVIVGWSGNAFGANNSHAFRWTQATGMTSLGLLNGGSSSEAFGVSADGSVVVGSAQDGSAGNAQRAFRWTQATGMTSLGTLNGGNSSQAIAASANGSVIVGTAADGNAGNRDRAFRWTQATGMVSLDPLNIAAQSFAQSVSADGNIVAGFAFFTPNSGGSQFLAFRWTQATGIVTLGTLSGGSFSIANGISADGRVVVGAADQGSPATNRAFRWTQSTGMQTVEEWVRSNGIPVAPAFATNRAVAINADGSVVAGALENGPPSSRVCRASLTYPPTISVCGAPAMWWQ